MPFQRFAAAAFLLTAVAAQAQVVAVVKQGSFEGRSRHVTTGSAAIVEQDGAHFVSLGRDFAFDGAPDPKVASLAIIAMLTGVTTWYREGGRLGREAVGDIYWDMVRKAVAA